MTDSLDSENAGLLTTLHSVTLPSERLQTTPAPWPARGAGMTTCGHQRATFPNTVSTCTFLGGSKAWLVSQAREKWLPSPTPNGITIEISFQKNVLIVTNQPARTSTVKQVSVTFQFLINIRTYTNTISDIKNIHASDITNTLIPCWSLRGGGLLCCLLSINISITLSWKNAKHSCKY